MKPISIISIVLFSCFLGVLIIACHKEQSTFPDQRLQTGTNHAPLANAGPDLTVNVQSCAYNHWIELDGSMSTDRDRDDNIIHYQWRRFSGPSSVVLNNDGAPKAQAYFQETGQYVFILQVTDQRGSSSEDTVIVTVSGLFLPAQFDLDMTLNSNYSFHTHEKYWCDRIFNVELCLYSDVTAFAGSFNYPQLGQMIFSMHENADTAASSTTHDTQMSISINVAPSKSVGGPCTINFKKLIEQGGGLFSGTWKLEEGSAKQCDQYVFANRDPLIVSGNVDTTAHTMNLRIQGKAYF